MKVILNSYFCLTIQFLLSYLNFISASKEVFLTNDIYYLPDNRIDYIQKSNLTFYGDIAKNEDAKYFNVWGLPVVDATRFNVVKLVKTPAQIGTDKYSFNKILKNGDDLKLGENYYINYTLNDNAISSTALKKIWAKTYYDPANPYEHKWDAECQFNSYPAQFQLAFQKAYGNIKKIVSWGGLAFAIFNGKEGIHVVKYNNLQPTFITLTNSIDSNNNLNNQNFNDIFIINQFNLDDGYLVIISDSDTIIFKLILSRNGVDINLELYAVFGNNVYYSPKNITGFGLNENNLIVSTLDYGILVLKDFKTIRNRNMQAGNPGPPGSANSGPIVPAGFTPTSNTTNTTNTTTTTPTTSTTSTTSTSTSATSSSSKFKSTGVWKTIGMVTYYTDSNNVKTVLKVKDFIIFNKTIYLLAQGFGLKILKLGSVQFLSIAITETNLKDSNFLKTIPLCFAYATANNGLEHPHLKKLDYYYNPLTNYGYVGILVDSSETVPEFFIELIIQDNEEIPLVNKIFYSPTVVLADTFTTDTHWSFILDKSRKTLIILRRGLLNPISELTYNAPLTLLINNLDLSTYVPIVHIYDTGLQKLGIAFTSPSLGLSYLNNFEFFDDELVCKFNDEDFYHVGFSSQTVIFDPDYIDKDKYCTLWIYNPIKVKEKVIPYLRTLGIILGILLTLIAMGITVTVLTCTKCCHKNCFEQVEKKITGYVVREQQQYGSKVELEDKSSKAANI